MTLSVDKNRIINIEAISDKTSYILKHRETVDTNITASITFVNLWGYIETVANIPDISVTVSSISTYSDGKISGIKEGTTTLTTSLYGLTITDMLTITVHESNLTIIGMRVKSQQNRPAQRAAQKLLPALSVAIQKLKQSRQ